MIVPTRRAAYLLAAAAPLALLGFLDQGWIALLLSADAMILAAIGLDSRLAADPKALRVERQAQEAFSIGRPSECSYVWSNSSRWDARLIVREVRPSILDGPLPARTVRVPAGASIRETLDVRPARRGRERHGWFAARSVGPLGLGMRQARISLPWEVTVYPSLPASRLKASIAAAVRRRDPGLRNVRRLGVGRQFESLREWVPGDDTRLIDWKATARRRKPIVREFEEERRQQVLLVMDCGRMLTPDLAGESRMEYVVRAALWLAFAAQHHDDNVGVMAFAEDILHYVPPQRAKRGLRRVLDVLATAEARLVEPDYPAAFRYLAVRNRKRALTILFTDVIDELASQALVANVASLRPRHLPLVVTLRDPALDRIAETRPGSVREAYRKAAAEELLAARGAALGRMRRAGSLVLDVHPDRAADAAVEKYLELKRHGRL